MNYEEKILTYLVDNYRKSKKDAGNNKSNRRTQVKPEKLYKKYNANDGDFEEISKFNQAVECLSKRGFVNSIKETFGTQIQCIYLADERIQDVEQYLADRYDYVSKDMRIEGLQNIVNKYMSASPICQKECERLLEYISNRKVPKNFKELDDILSAVAFIEKNQENLYIREVSMKVYGDSKYFENTTLQPVCSMFRKYLKRDIKDNEMFDEILLDYHIAKEPQKLCIKGKVIINISGKEIDISEFSEGIEFYASDLLNIQSIRLMVPQFMTIENRASYLRYHKDDVVTFYLGGYVNRYQRDFIKMVYASNMDACYLHFGDIDAGGFWIHHNLCEVTGVNFKLFSMSVFELKNCDYASCLHELTDNDKIRLEGLKFFDAYEGVVQYMLSNNVKLEQEIISLALMNVLKEL
ncbi:MAG: DUF2220 domain-containing protein [Clostridium sp.]|nr:DUF2220 domain-containing protein [Clostridium sp.]MCM1459023.1 DUF2220 domain-containing protein [Bacteroides sp.]